MEHLRFAGLAFSEAEEGPIFHTQELELSAVDDLKPRVFFRVARFGQMDSCDNESGERAWTLHATF